MSVPNLQIRFSYDDYQTLPEGARYELLEGDLIMSPAPTTLHQRILLNLAFFFASHCRQTNLGEIFFSPIDVVFGSGDEREVVQPDLIFIASTRQQIITPKEIQGAPDLIVEILSPATAERDRIYKRHLYGRYGVREYWIVDPDDKTVDVYSLGERGLTLVQAYRTPLKARSAVLSGLEIALADVFDH